MEKTKSEYFKAWQIGKKRNDGKEMPENWTTIEYNAFENLGPRGLAMSFLRPRAMDEDDANVNTSREGARAVVKGNNKIKCEEERKTPFSEKDNARVAIDIAAQMARHTKLAQMKIVMQSI